MPEQFQLTDAAPLGLVVNRDEALVVRLWCTKAGPSTSIFINVRAVDESGKIRTSQHTIEPTAGAFTQSVQLIRLSPGRLLSAAVAAGENRFLPGECFVQLSISYRFNSSSANLIDLASGYLTFGVGIAWPFGQVASQFLGEGAAHVYSLNDPEAGAEIIQDFNSLLAVQLTGGSFVLTTAAVAGNRFVGLRLSVAGLVVWEVLSITAIPADTIARVVLSVQNVVPADTALRIYLRIPRMILTPTFRLETFTTALAPADEYSGIALVGQQQIVDPT